MVKTRRIIVLGLFVLGLAVSFWMVSRYPALNSKAAMSGTAAFEDKLTHQAHFHVAATAPLYEKILYTTLNWYETNWKGMAFGVAMAAGFLALLSHLPRKSAATRFKNSLLGMLMGTPLGVCVNCVAPIAKGIYEAGTRMETALAVMFSSPTLNIVILTMLFSIFPFYMAVLKIAATFLLVLVLVPLISRKTTPEAARSSVQTPPSMECVLESGPEPWSAALAGAFRDLARSLGYIAVRTVPLMFLAGLLGAAASHLMSFERFVGLQPSLANLSLISFLGTFLPLPIAFDLMLTQALMMSRLSDGFVMTLLFTLGTFSIYSAMIVYRTFSLKVAVQLYAIVFAIGVALGLAAQHYSDFRHVQWLAQYDKFLEEGKSPVPAPTVVPASLSQESAVWRTPKAGAPPTGDLIREEEGVALYQRPLERPGPEGNTPFRKLHGPDFGITYTNHLTPENFFDPLFFGRGIASGDFDNDGWTDLAVATNHGFELYRNQHGRRFARVDVPLEELKDKETITIALVDLDNDRFLDVFITTFGGGNWVWLNPLGKSGPRVMQVPNQPALLTSAVAFGDVNRDGTLDLVNGNYHLGVLTRNPVATAVDQLVINRDMKFEIHDLPGIPGQTHSVLLSDFNADGALDLVVGNDYNVSDTYYLGDNTGAFRKIRKQDGVVPVTTENTMSLDTADINNDLNLDLYLSNIGFSRGIDVVSNIFGRGMKQAGLDFCDSDKTVLERGECHRLVKLVTLLNPERQDTSERCTLLGDKTWIRQCMVTRMALLAAEKNDSALCQKISKGHLLGRKLCKAYFETRHLKVLSDEEVPRRTQENILLAGTDQGVFRDVSSETGVTTAEWSWNGRFADLDNDEWQDLYVVNGVLITQEFATNNFFHNEGGRRFSKAEGQFGLEDYDHSSSFTYLDIDNDGDLDIVANTLYGPFKVYLNQESKHHRLTLRLRDDRGNNFCIGCQVILRYGKQGEKHQVREVKAGGGFHSFDAPILHFGLGAHDTVRAIEVRWSTGERSVLEGGFSADRHYTLHRRAEPPAVEARRAAP